MEDKEKEQPALDETANAIKDSAEAIITIRRYEEIIETHNKIVINFVGKQRQLLQQFKGTEQFFETVGQSKSSIYFKMVLSNFLNFSNYFKNNFRLIEYVCKADIYLFIQIRRQLICVSVLSLTARIFVLFCYENSFTVMRTFLSAVRILFSCCKNFSLENSSLLCGKFSF